MLISISSVGKFGRKSEWECEGLSFYFNFHNLFWVLVAKQFEMNKTAKFCRRVVTSSRYFVTFRDVRVVLSFGWGGRGGVLSGGWVIIALLPQRSVS